MANEYAVNSADLVSVAEAIRTKGKTVDLLSFPAGFVEAIQGIRSGASLQVIAVSSSDNLPEEVEENTLAIITDQQIGNLYIYPAIPEAAAPGDVLILTTGKDKIINLTEDGTIGIGSAGVYIKQDESWSYVDAYIFVSGEWRFLWSSRLYYEGDEYVEYTGGFTTHAINSRSGASATPIHPGVEKNSDHIMANTTSSGSNGSGVGMLCTANMIDLTPYDTLVFEGTFKTNYTNYPQNFVVAAWSQIPDYYTNHRLAYFELTTSTVSKITVDVSNVNTTAYVGFGIAFSTVTLRRCYLIPKEIA